MPAGEGLDGQGQPGGTELKELYIPYKPEGVEQEWEIEVFVDESLPFGEPRMDYRAVDTSTGSVLAWEQVKAHDRDIRAAIRAERKRAWRPK